MLSGGRIEARPPQLPQPPLFQRRVGAQPLAEQSPQRSGASPARCDAATFGPPARHAAITASHGDTGAPAIRHTPRRTAISKPPALARFNDADAAPAAYTCCVVTSPCWRAANLAMADQCSMS